MHFLSIEAFSQGSIKRLWSKLLRIVNDVLNTPDDTMHSLQLFNFNYTFTTL